MSKTLQALIAIQSKLKAPKDQNAGRYRYRNIEDINEAVKPLAAECGCAVVYTDRFEDDLCISTCSLIGDDDLISATGVSMVNTSPKNMSIEQSSGAASSYARKYAACGLFAIDSSENDPDKVNAKPQEHAKPKPQNGAVDKAKKRLWAVINRYSELQGLDPKKVAQDVTNRDDYRETAAYLDAVADEFESQL